VLSDSIAKRAYGNAFDESTGCFEGLRFSKHWAFLAYFGEGGKAQH